MAPRSVSRVAQRVWRRGGTLFVLSAPSGSGKTTLVRHLLARMPRLTRSVSLTTRPRRRGERAGRDYRFISRARFMHARAQGQCLEWAKVHEYFYATPRAAVQRALRRGRDVVLVIDVQGAAAIKRRIPSSVAIFLLPPSWEALAHRLRRRATEDAGTIHRRLHVARQEVQAAQRYDYVVINDRLSQAVDELAAIVTAERHRVIPRPARSRRLSGRHSRWSADGRPRAGRGIIHRG